MGVTEGHGQQLTLGDHAVTDTDELLLDGEAFGHADHHVVDEGAVQAVHRTEAGKVAGTLELDFISLDGDLDVRIDFLAHLTKRAFHLHDVAVEKLSFRAGRKDYRQFSNS